MLIWHSCQLCYPLEIKILLLLLNDQDPKGSVCLIVIPLELDIVKQTRLRN